MTIFRMWAPRATRVAVRIGDSHIPLASHGTRPGDRGVQPCRTHPIRPRRARAAH